MLEATHSQNLNFYEVTFKIFESIKSTLYSIIFSLENAFNE